MLEIQRQKEDGYSIEAINEGLFDFIPNLDYFGGITDTLKEMLMEWLINNVMPGGENTPLGQFVIVAFGNLPLTEIPKIISSCDELTKFLARTVIEYIVKSYAESKGGSGQMFDVLRNVFMSTIQDSRFNEVLEDNLGKLVCSAYDSLTSTLKQFTGSGDKETAQGNA